MVEPHSAQQSGQKALSKVTGWLADALTATPPMVAGKGSFCQHITGKGGGKGFCIAAEVQHHWGIVQQLLA